MAIRSRDSCRTRFRPQSWFWTIPRVISLLFLIFLKVSANNGKTTCSMPSVERLQDTVLICHFPEDLGLAKKDFTVYHYVNKNNPDAVLDCWWLGGKLDCFSKLGFSFSKTVSTHLSATVTKVNNTHEGSYACQVAGFGPSSLGTCEFKLKIGKDNRCNIIPDRPNQANLTCYFNEDVSKTQSNITVYRHTGTDEQSPVLNCWWDGQEPKCWVESGYQLFPHISSYLILRLPNGDSNYSCGHASSVSNSGDTKMCQMVKGKSYFSDKGSGRGETEETTLTIIIIAGITAGVVLIILGIFLLIILKRRKSAMNRGRQDDAAQQPMLGVPMANRSKEKKPKSKKARQLMTQQFSDYLLQSVTDMFPEIMTGCFFVPPVYFNTTRYTTTIVGDQVANIPQSPDARAVTHDKNVQRVLHCLRHWAEHRRENMFVVTQLEYEDYLNGDDTFAGHTLPKATDLDKKNKAIKCFDLMIIHRQHGVVLGVVVDVDLADDSRGDEEEDKTVLSDLSDAIQQLKKAEGVVSHVMSDLSQCLPIRKTLIFPLLSVSSLQRALEADVAMAEELRGILNVKIFKKSASEVSTDALQKISADRLQTPEHVDHSTSSLSSDHAIRKLDDSATTATADHTSIIKTFNDLKATILDNPIRACLCADHLSDLQNPSDVTQTVLEDLEQWWSVLTPSGSDDQQMNDDLYQKIISRVCGPATTPTFFMPGASEPVLLPKTLDQAVSLTGELFERLTLYPDMTDLLKEPRLFICGPPGTGKTTMLMLAGRSWLSEGHDVYILKTSESRLEQSLKMESSTRPSDDGVRGQVFVYSANIHDEKSRKSAIKEILKHSGQKAVHIIAYELECDTEDVKDLLENFLKVNNSQDCMWITLSRGSRGKAVCRTEIFTRPLRCPPAVVREASAILTQHFPDVKPYSPSGFPPPTDGPSVKHIYHAGHGHTKGQPRDCEHCANEVANFLTRIIRTSQSDSEEGKSDVTQKVRQEVRRQFSLHARDVMILFESDVDQTETTMLKKLKDAHIIVDVTAAPSAGDSDVTTAPSVGDSDVALAGEASRLCGEKRKVVVYVEDNVDNSGIWWTRVRGITSCSSQLIRVMNGKSGHKT
ncbi:uncharacterized protein LOC112576075 isoform X2 [Pomacea canaliculata]|uniref:uncharacterized protein LOC112576075 isoform X2 n=1 Tax=Pomacea canaliculata TaxID=400727 RepID=UPI000D732D44|nr:uncharacterized protein LOC112576075 isoform X2 [Pomacea canaliculata]